MILLQRYSSYYYWGYYYSLWGMLCLPNLCLRQRCSVYCWGLRVQRAMKVIKVTIAIIIMIMQLPIYQKFNFLLWRYLARGGSGLLALLFSLCRVGNYLKLEWIFLTVQRGSLGSGLPFYRVVGRVGVSSTSFPQASMTQSLISCFYVFIHAILSSSPSSLENYLFSSQASIYSQEGGEESTVQGYSLISQSTEFGKAFPDGQIIVFTMLQFFEMWGGLLIETGRNGIYNEVIGDRQSAIRKNIKAFGQIFILTLNIINNCNDCVMMEQSWVGYKSVIEVVLDVVIRLLPTIHSGAVDQIVLVGRSIPCFGAFIHRSLRMVHLSLLPLASLVGLGHCEIVALEDLHLLLHSFHLSCYCMAYFFSQCSYLYDESYLVLNTLHFFLLLPVLDALRRRGLGWGLGRWRFGWRFYLLLDLCIWDLNYRGWQLLIMIVEIYQWRCRKQDFISYTPEEISYISYQSSFEGSGQFCRQSNKDQQPMFWRQFGMFNEVESQQIFSKMSKDWTERRQHQTFNYLRDQQHRSTMSFQCFQIYYWKYSQSCWMLRIVFNVFMRLKMFQSQFRHYFKRNYLKLVSLLVIWVMITSQSPLPKSMNKLHMIFNTILSN